MAASQDPNFDLYHSWSLGESGWNTGMDANLQKIGALIHLSVLSATTTAQPGTPTSGDRYIVPTSATGTDWTGHDNDIAVYTGSTWVFYTPSEGWEARVEDTSKKYAYTSSTWADETTSGGTTTFTGLTDTPASYSGQAGKIAAVNTGETALEFIAAPASVGSVAFSGARSSVQTPITGINGSSDYVVVFDTEDLDTDGYINIAGSPTKITIPGGINKAQLFACIKYANMAATSFYGLNIDHYNSSDVLQQTYGINGYGTSSTLYASTLTPLVSVSPGDYFVLRVDTIDSAFDINEASFSVVALQDTLPSQTIQGAAPTQTFTETTNNTDGTISLDSTGSLTFASDVNNEQASSKTIFTVDGAEIVRISPYGLSFNGDTAAANALDDYEEGTYTPTLNANLTVTSVSQVWRYRKIGSLVFVSGGGAVNAVSGTDNVSISLPFTPKANEANGYNDCVSPIMTNNIATGDIGLVGFIPGGVAEIRPYKINNNGAWTRLTNSDLASGDNFRISMCYIAG